MQVSRIIMVLLHSALYGASNICPEVLKLSVDFEEKQIHLEGFSGLLFQEDFFFFISENTTIYWEHSCKNSFSGNT